MTNLETVFDEVKSFQGQRDHQSIILMTSFIKTSIKNSITGVNAIIKIEPTNFEPTSKYQFTVKSQYSPFKYWS